MSCRVTPMTTSTTLSLSLQADPIAEGGAYDLSPDLQRQE